MGDGRDPGISDIFFSEMPTTKTPAELTTGASESNQEKRKPGRPKKGFTKVLVSLEPVQAQLLAHAAFMRGAVEGRRGDVSALIRKIIDKSEYWQSLSMETVRALEAINKSALGKQKLKEMLGDRKNPGEVTRRASLREAYLTALGDRSRLGADEFSLRDIDLVQHVMERLTAQAAAAVKRAREKAGLTPQGLAKRAGLPLKKVESAERGYIDGEVATLLAGPLGVDPHDLCPRDLWQKK